MDNIIYIIEDRNYVWIYHFIVYIIGGLRHINNNNNDVNNKVKIHFENVPYRDLYKEVIDILRYKYDYIETMENVNELRMRNPQMQIIKLHGEPIFPCSNDITLPTTHINLDVFKFLRELFLSYCKQQCNIDFPVKPFRNIYISRNNSHLVESNRNHGNIKRRHVINEPVVKEMLAKYNFEFIEMEKLSVVDKIKCFMESALVVSPQSGGLTFSMCSHLETKIIELCPDNPHQFCSQYKEACAGCNISWQRVITTKADNLDNMIVDINALETVIKNLIE